MLLLQMFLCKMFLHNKFISNFPSLYDWQIEHVIYSPDVNRFHLSGQIFLAVSFVTNGPFLEFNL